LTSLFSVYFFRLPKGGLHRAPKGLKQSGARTLSGRAWRVTIKNPKKQQLRAACIVAVSFDERQLHHFDPDALLHVLDNTEMEHRLLDSGTLSAHLQRLGLGEVTINAGDYRFSVCARGGIPQGQAFVGLYSHIAGEARENYHAVSLNQIQLYAPGMELHFTSSSPTGWLMVMLPLERLQKWAIAQHGVELDWPRQGLRCLDLNPMLAERLRRELRRLLRIGKNLASLPNEGLTESLTNEGLIQLLVQAIVDGTLSAPPQSTLTAGRRRALAAMEACIERWKENPADDLRVVQIEGTSERMLELAAREAYRVTPHYWLKLARLNTAYRDLLSGRSASVTDVCLRWRFNHMGYFARDYRALFGESPRDTLQRGRTICPAADIVPRRAIETASRR
jgi:AraC family ethanolamine operon transcriptional activator